MAQLMRVLTTLSWLLGLLSIVAGVVIKLMQMEMKFHVTGHTMFDIASAFFLCALATRYAMQAPSSS